MPPTGPGSPRRRQLAALLAALPAWAPLAGALSAEAPAPADAPALATRLRGRVSWYGRRFAGRVTASGEVFDAEALTMAHRALPFGTRVRVTNLRNRRSVVVRVNDRGPHTGGRIGDVSLAAARALGMLRNGVVEARLELLDPPDAEEP